MDESLEVKGPGGWMAKFSGEKTPLMLLAILCMSSIAYGGWMHHEKSHEDHQQVKDHLAEMTYVLSLTQEERQRLNLSMPDSLRQKVRRKRDEP